MDIEMIETLLNGIVELVGEEEVSAYAALPLLSAQLLLHIYKKLESIDDGIASLVSDSWDEHHNR